MNILPVLTSSHLVRNLGLKVIKCGLQLVTTVTRAVEVIFQVRWRLRWRKWSWEISPWLKFGDSCDGAWTNLPVLDLASCAVQEKLRCSHTYLANHVFVQPYIHSSISPPVHPFIPPMYQSIHGSTYASAHFFPNQLVNKEGNKIGMQYQSCHPHTWTYMSTQSFMCPHTQTKNMSLPFLVLWLWSSGIGLNPGSWWCVSLEIQDKHCTSVAHWTLALGPWP